MNILKHNLKIEKEIYCGTNKLHYLKIMVCKEPTYYRWKFIKYLRKSGNTNNLLYNTFYRKLKNLYASKIGFEISGGV